MNSIELAQIARLVTLHSSHAHGLQTCLYHLTNILGCDAAALLLYRQDRLIPVATVGLNQDVMGRQFKLSEHPRFEIVAKVQDLICFHAADELPDPFDGLLLNCPEPHIHACLGLPLLYGREFIGVLSLEALQPNYFHRFSQDSLRVLMSTFALALYCYQQQQLLEVQVFGGKSKPISKQMVKEMVGESDAIQQLKHSIQVVAQSELNVLIEGETGVGKELVAEKIHRYSNRNQQPMVYLNCAALPENLAESELFGHIKGAFTGAIQNRKGKFEQADGGTLFLDEIGELSLNLQAKLLRVLQYGDLQRLGDDQHRVVDVRVIAATNKRLAQAVQDQTFRADLYHRLSVYPIEVPPLRDRQSDIVLLAGYFLELSRCRLGLSVLRLAPSCLPLLEQYSWPGNIRELEHQLRRAALIARSEQGIDYVTIQPEYFNFTQQPSVTEKTRQAPKRGDKVTIVGSLRENTDQFQRQLIEQQLTGLQGNWAKTAQALQLDRANLHRLAKRLGLK
ncbi:TPA: nitric oxide reductase transcriptional regulator NorR [Photobacterium damselae]|uniref:nitric oxide reductase transcriptional regulator NorR n=1 Tax=Photobacterium damselae TaxID=38293 RepID=UPI0040685ACB